MKIRKFLIFNILISYFAMSQTIPPGDPLVNTVQSQGVIGLDFTGPGNDEKIAYFIINSNSSTGFELKLELTNRGAFRNGASFIPMTSLVLNRSSGILGTGLTDPVNLDVLAVVSSGGEFTWNPGNTPSTVTSNYIVELKADWANPSAKLAGFYFETITVTITVGL